MSTQHSQNESIIKKKLKLDKVDKNVNSIAEYKRCAILRYCNKNGNIKKLLEKFFTSNEIHKLSLLYCLHLCIENTFI